MENGTKLSKFDEGEKVDPTFFKSLVGSLRYFTCTRPDIVFAVGVVSRFMEAPTSTHLKRENMVLCLTLDLLVSLARESCYHFVNCGGMEQLGYCFVSSLQNSSALKLLHLGVIEQATSHSVGCEGFLGWWPREDENIPSGTSERYNQLLKLLLHNLRHDVASLATYILHRLRFYEVSSRYECSILSVLGGLSGSGQATSATMDILANAKLQLKNFLKLINSSGPIEDSSLVACASKSLVLGDAGQLFNQSLDNSVKLLLF
uniref:Uncharacterized protein LOC104232762 n=1 Tax=Nicotiana sylvestris TaxID=4096 RepID=A0A1U7XCZ3_NICSY|nr:PREDICTED: uncharacterized protein LOC104232762 [Nicotiana sylvestris]